jgi:hypothetical protein
MSAAPPIVLTSFTGEQPRIIPRLMPETAAQSAVDVRLDDGGLTPVRDSAFITHASGLDAKTIYLHGDDWLDWDTVVNAVPGPVADDRLYYTGDGVPKVRFEDDSVRELKVDAPVTALTATLGGSGSGDVVTRVYSYTNVTEYGEETEPAPLSNEVLWKPGNTVTLSGFAIPASAATRGITKQRIYRSQTSASGTVLYFIDERNVSTGDYVDSIPVDQIAEPCPSITWNAPPDDLEGLITLPNGQMAAFVGKRLYFCEPYHPHAWPEIYILTVDYEIVGLGAMGTSVLVVTTGQPYLVSGTHPSAMKQEKVEQNYPGINKRSIVDLGYAIAYISNEGVIIAQGNGSFSIATSNIFNREKWYELSPETMICAQLNGRYVAFYDTTLADGTRQSGALFIEMPAPSFLTRTAVLAEAAYYDINTSALFYNPPNSTHILRMDSPIAARKKLYWRSKEFVLPYPENYGAFMVESVEDLTPADDQAYQTALAEAIAINTALLAAGPVHGELAAEAICVLPVAGDILVPMPKPSGLSMTLGVYADKTRVATVHYSNTPVRLPSGFKARKWELDIYTNARIERMVMAKNMDDLKRTS